MYYNIRALSTPSKIITGWIKLPRQSKCLIQLTPADTPYQICIKESFFLFRTHSVPPPLPLPQLSCYSVWIAMAWQTYRPSFKSFVALQESGEVWVTGPDFGAVFRSQFSCRCPRMVGGSGHTVSKDPRTGQFVWRHIYLGLALGMVKGT